MTMGLVVLSAVSTMRGRRQVTVFRRSISQQDISNAVSVALLVLGLSLFGSCGAYRVRPVQFPERHL